MRNIKIRRISPIVAADFYSAKKNPAAKEFIEKGLLCMKESNSPDLEWVVASIEENGKILNVDLGIKARFPSCWDKLRELYVTFPGPIDIHYFENSISLPEADKETRKEIERALGLKKKNLILKFDI